ncbi:glycoside hydrolase family 65 protein [Williamsia sterculiae]|uniref:Alpha,alpha-trehalose phosphorylase n=1 Tax=Williamsia sterculiae TaxID=1344003 RepID=A0A1N7D2U4_9NOCA|nr:glycosyl hydrolase family 65 protein [Williamsia sterculiae]SIR70047.1 alpha,alpha-trehalose phosphorylase [Williamsia sterculiae]
MTDTETRTSADENEQTFPDGRIFDIDPWTVTWRGDDLDEMDRTESVFALANGHVGLRGTFEEGEPVVQPGSYLNGFYEEHELPYAEGGYGYPESGQTVVNVTDGKVIRLLVEDEPLDLRYGKVIDHVRTLDLRSGTLRRHVIWVSPTGRAVRITSERFVSFTERSIAAIRYAVEPVDGRNVKVVIQSDLLANEPVAKPEDGDPRRAAALDAPLVADFAAAEGMRAVLVHHTRQSEIRVAVGMDHELVAPHVTDRNGDHDPERCSIEAQDDLARLTISTTIPEGQKLELTKYLGYGWSARRSVPALRAQADAALALAKDTGFDELLASQRHFLDSFWEACDVEITGDAELQQATRFALFQVLQAGARGETRAIPAKGLTGPGYDGHAFWDTESFVLPFLTYNVPLAAEQALRWRHSTLDKARQRAHELGQAGAMFPWRSINGDECSSYWPAGTAAVHIGADIARAVAQYVNATGDDEFEAECGVELLAETARMWAAMGHHDSDGRFRIDGVTGPDEYSAVADNNTFTNLMAQRNLEDAVSSCRRNPEVASALGVSDDELQTWEKCASSMTVPFNEVLQVHEQSEAFTKLAPWNLHGTPAEHYPLLMHYPYYDLYRKQVVKQADLVLALYMRGDAFTADEKKRNLHYYEPLTVRDSSLSACCQGIVAAEVGYMDLAFDYFVETALTDLHDLHRNVSNGLHVAAMAGTWLSCVAGFGGMRDYDGNITFAPRMHPALGTLTFRLTVRGSTIRVSMTEFEATYDLLAGKPIDLAHHGEQFTLDGDTVIKSIPELDPGPAPAQPPHRPPYRRPSPR